ncbi:MAG: membrane protein insertase YidC [Flavobacteriales bacterium]|nr:membrane protein insertase YidC [Flavobacteriales bacterium]
MLEDKGGTNTNSIIGIVLIFLILIGFSYFTRPSQEQIDAARFRQDSIVAAQQVLIQKQEQERSVQAIKETADEGTGNPSQSLTAPDSSKAYGPFEKAMFGEQKFYTIENELLKITINNLGGRIQTVELKNYQTYDSLPLNLFTGDSTVFNMVFFSGTQRIETQERFFEAHGQSFEVEGTNGKSLSMRLYADDDSYIEYLYTLAGNSYNLDMRMNFHRVDDAIASNSNSLSLNWQVFSPRQEKNLKLERINSTVYFKHIDDEVDYLSETSDEMEKIPTKIKWVAFKGQFFSSILTADETFDTPTVIETVTDEEDQRHVKLMKANFGIPYAHLPDETFAMEFYFGPNNYSNLQEYDMGYEEIIPLGWGIFRWVNVGLIIPMFKWLGKVIDSYGIIILIMTIFIKMLLFPLMYKSYKSTAKMRVLKPQVDEIGEKYPNKDDAMKKQQAVMALYKKTGVNPLGGCLPMLVQFPILIAMYRFFPSSIELRQQPFLWATDLSSYDSIYDFPNGFEIPFYGDHVSLFTLLMTVATLLSVKMNAEMSGGGQMQMPQMKIMMYMMPIMFLGFFNDFASALSYYYFIATMITFGQQYLMRRFVDEEVILQKIQDHKKKPAAPKSKFQKRLEKMAKDKGYKG